MLNLRTVAKTSWVAGTLLVVTACGDYTPPNTVVVDSAGVRITLTVDGPTVIAELDSVPSLSLGGADALGPTQFFRVQGLHLDSENRLWVADSQSGELRVFEPDGTHWKTRGGRGEGPGEFSQVRLLGATAADTVLLGDARNDRVTIFDPDGEFVRTERLSGLDGPAPLPFGVFEDGSLLSRVRRVLASRSLEPGQILRDSVELVRASLTTQRELPYGSGPGPLWLWTGRNQVPVPFTIPSAFEVVGQEVHLASGPDFRIRVFGRDGLQAVYGVDRPVRAVGEPDLASYRGFVDEYLPTSMHEDYLEALDHEERPTQLPGYDRLITSEDGHVWAQVYESDLAAPHDWDVFDGEGRFLGRVHVWSDFYPMAITRDAIVGVWRDPMGVEFVRRYPLIRKAEGT